MFGKKKTHAETDASQTDNITVIPDIFYGGKDPAVYASAGKSRNGGPRAAGMFFSWKKIFLISAPIFVVAVAGMTWYYVRQARPNQNQKGDAIALVVSAPETQTRPAPAEEISPADVLPPPTSAPTTTTVPLIAATPSAKAEATLSFPAIFLTDSPDADADGLTDAEEEIFGTDSGIWDTDGDGYYDGQELLNLYNPKGTSPVKLVDSGFVKEYVNPKSGYRLYYPSAWEVGAVEDDARVLFNSITGDFIEARVLPKVSTESFSDWFAAVAPGEQFANLIPLTNRFQTQGYKRKDDLVAYFPADASVVVIIYHPTASADAISFRHVVALMAASFRFGAGSPPIAEQTALPVAP